MLYLYHSGNETRRVKILDTFVPHNYIEINPLDAEKLGVKNGKMLKVIIRRGDIKVSVRISGRPKTGVVFISFHFREAAANVLTNPVLGPVAKIPEYKVATYKIEKV